MIMENVPQNEKLILFLECNVQQLMKNHRDVEHKQALAKDQQCSRGLEFQTKQHYRKATA
jgi:hypothetical protein